MEYVIGGVMLFVVLFAVLFAIKACKNGKAYDTKVEREFDQMMRAQAETFQANEMAKENEPR